MTLPNPGPQCVTSEGGDTKIPAKIPQMNDKEFDTLLKTIITQTKCTKKSIIYVAQIEQKNHWICY